MRYYVIRWHEGHHTFVRTDTRGRRSKRLRRMVRAARRGDLERAWALMMRDVYARFL